MEASNRWWLVLVLPSAIACGGGGVLPDGGSPSIDGGATDAHATDAGSSDAAAPDASATDASATDASAHDTDSAATADASSATCADAGAPVGTECNALAVAGAPVPVTIVGTIAPAGGTIVDGEYDLVTYAAETAMTATFRAHLSICGRTMQVVNENALGAETTTLTFTVAGHQITLTPSCGSYWDGTNGYDATSDTFVLYGGGNHALTYHRR
jgi:hypothetical protein